MGESGSRKRKRHDSLLEPMKTVKAVFKKDDLDDSLSTSDWGLVIDTEQSKKKNKKRDIVKLEEEPLSLVCEWNSCSQNFTNYDGFIRHLDQHLRQHILQIDVTLDCCWQDCSYSAVSVKDLSNHLCFHGYHTKLKSVGHNVELRAKLPACTQSEHFSMPAFVDGYQCEWQSCNKHLDTIFDFFQHVRLHVYHNPKGPKEGPIHCKWKGCTCVKSFPNQYKLTEHVRMHTKERIIACPTCGNLFVNKTKFCDHRKRQLPINLQSYLCSTCSKFFPSERLLRDHMRLHINNYKCSMCEMTCPKPSILAKHIRYRHLHEKPYKCDQCDYTCVSKHNLDLHLKKHDDVDQFKCDDCDFSCRSAFGLDKHYHILHGKGDANIYECHNCKKRFPRGGILTKHLMKVHNYHWPSGHSRFRYKEEQDGIYRLQTVRYETLDVTEEIIKGKTRQGSSSKQPLHFQTKLKQPEDENSIFNFEVVLTGSAEEEKKVVITIDDVDAKGNVVKSQTIQSEEIICSEDDDEDNV